MPRIRSMGTPAGDGLGKCGLDLGMGVRGGRRRRATYRRCHPAGRADPPAARDRTGTPRTRRPRRDDAQRDGRRWRTEALRRVRSGGGRAGRRVREIRTSDGAAGFGAGHDSRGRCERRGGPASDRTPRAASIRTVEPSLQTGLMAERLEAATGMARVNFERARMPSHMPSSVRGAASPGKRPGSARSRDEDVHLAAAMSRAREDSPLVAISETVEPVRSSPPRRRSPASRSRRPGTRPPVRSGQE